jgi:hypothetical protein
LRADRPIFDWTRYWCPREGHIRVDEHGYLVSPVGDFGATMNPDLVTWDSLARTRCLVLLGEPGIGKSSAIHAWRGSIEAVPPVPGRRHHWLDIAGHSEDRLRRRLFESPELRAWREGTDHLSVILDSFDESGIDYLGSVLADELEALPRDRLSLAIACRTLHWPAYLEKDLRRLWDDDTVGVYELAPLTYEDVVLAAGATLADRADDFLREISRLSLGSLASKPFTLRFLLDSYSNEGRLPPSQVEVYEHGFWLLAAETSERRRDEGRMGIWTPDERFAIATRIAAVLAFGNCTAVSTAVAGTALAGGELTIAGMAGGTEPIPRGTVDVTEAAVLETLASGLFSGRGQHRMGFWHRTAEDFLAARYVRNRDLDPEQAMGLLVHPADPQGRIAPRLRSVAAWVAALIPSLLPRIAAADPEVLISSDIQITDPETKAKLVDAALQMFDRGEMVFAVLGPYYRLDRLAHPGIAEQLRPWMAAPGESEGRIAAFCFARECHVSELESEVLRVALDPAEPERIRFWALLAAGTIIAPEKRAILRPLAFIKSGDSQYHLKGTALEILFPSHLSLDDVFTAISASGDHSFGGAYEHFVTSHLPENIRDEDLPKALRWIAAEGRSVWAFAMRHAADRLMRRAWAFIDQDDVRDALALVAWSRLKRDERVFSRQILDKEEADPLDDATGRRRLLTGMVPLLRDPERDAFHLLYGDGSLTRFEDVPWIVEQAVVDADNAWTWAYLTGHTASIGEAEHANSILEAAERSPAIRERFAGALGALDLDSPEARQLKADHLRRERRERRRGNSRDPRFTPTAPEIERLLAKAESEAINATVDAQPDAFWHLIHILRFQPSGEGGMSEFVLDIPKLPGWEAANAETRHRINTAARKYLLQRVPDHGPMSREGQLYRPEIAGYMALRHLGREDPSWFAQLEPEICERWLPSLIAAEFVVGSGQERDLSILKQGKAACPQAFADAFVDLFRAELDRGRGWVLEPLMELVDESVVSLTAAWLHDVRDRPEVYRALLRPLVQLGSRTAIDEALTNIPAPPPHDNAARWTAVESARALLAFAPEEGWPVIWKAIQSDDDFGALVLGSSLESLPEHRSLIEFPAQHLGDLYVWLARRSDAADRRRSRNELPSRIERLESQVLELLSGRSDPETVAVLRGAAEELPNRPWLRRTIRRVEGRTLEQTWVAPAPNEILALEGRRNNRLIRNDAQLASVVLESLGRLQERLNLPNPPTFALWDRARDTWRPKEEERLSDFIADHLRFDLRQHGLIVNREVEIREKQGGAPGEIPDIIVSKSVAGASPETTRTASVVIEVKGCWHPEVLDAMKTQLRDRYLERAGSDAGIYCVGWYECPQWDRTDRRRKVVPVPTLQALREQLTSQATSLSQGGRRVDVFVLDAALP